GDARSNVLTGLGGSNLLEGGDGADVLDGDFFQRAQADPRLVGTPGHNRVDGGSGNDTLFGGPSADVLLGGAGFADTVSYDNSESAVNVDLAAGRARGAGLDRINGVE